MKESALEDPQIKKLLRRLKETHKTDPWVVPRVLAHLRSGILTKEDLIKGKTGGTT